MKSFTTLFKWEKPFIKMVLSLAIPIFFQSLIGQSLNLIDNLMVSRLGDAAYAGIAQANRFSMVAHVMLFGVSTGTAIFVSQFWGAKQIDNMKKANGLGFICGMVISTVLMLFCYLFNPQIIGLFLPQGESFVQAQRYLYAIAPMFPLFAVSNAYSTLLRSEEKTKYPMLAGIFSVITNTTLNYLLIEGHFGFPRLEVVGAGIATSISALVQMLITIYFSLKYSESGKGKLKEFFGFDFAFVKNFAKTVSPVILNETFWSLGMAVYAMFYGRRGDIAVAALGVYNTIDGIGFVLIYALVSATSILVGKTLGANDKELSFLYAKRLVLGCMLTSLVLGGLVLVFLNPILSIFSSLSPESLSLARKIVFISTAFIWIRSFNAVLVVAILRAGGDTITSLILDVIFVWGLAIPLLALATRFTNWPIHLLFLLTLSDEVMKFIFGVRRFRSGKWAKNLTEKA